VLFAQAIRRERLARIRQDVLLPPSQMGDCKVSEEAFLLSEQERAILEQIAIGRTNAKAALALGISPHTVKNQLAKLSRKLGVWDRTSLVVMALRKRWIAVVGE